MANPIPPPTQRLIVYLRDASAHPSKKCIITCIALGIIFLGALVTSGLGILGLLGNKSKDLEISLIVLFTVLLVLFGIVLLVLVCYKYCPTTRPTQQRNLIVPPGGFPQPILLPRLPHIPSIDSGLGFDNSLLDSPPLDRPRRNTTTSNDSGISVDII